MIAWNDRRSVKDGTQAMAVESTIERITVNGVSEPLAAADLAALLREKGIDEAARGVALALNGAVVPRAAWSGTRLTGGDVVEIVRARQGG
jgi:sulfur carrier protein